MNPAIHPVEPEEVMAFHDGELERADAARVEAHLRDCSDCHKLAQEMNMVSQQVQSWDAGTLPNEAAQQILGKLVNGGAVLTPHAPQSNGRRLAARLLAAAAVVLMFVWISVPNLLRAPGTARFQDAIGFPEPETALKKERVMSDGQRTTLPSGNLLQNSGPMVIHTVGLAIVAEDYAKVRASLDRILVAHNGFSAELSATDSKGSAQALTATLRVPADKLASAVAELKKLGRVENETHNGEEVTQQYTDLNARLSNARNTEQRLIAVLQQRTGKVRDILEVEQEIARVREEIERMDAQRRTMENQVQLATIQLQIREDYKASLDVTPPSTGTRLWNSLVAGITSAANTIVVFILFALEAGPTLLLWVAVLFLPARFAWRRLRPMWNMPNLG